MAITEEFITVDLILNSEAETRGVDAFALSLIKAERQMRKLFTHLIFQFACFKETDIPELRNTLFHNKNMYFENFEMGINEIFSKSVEDLIGHEYEALLGKVKIAIQYRNKIFHGQLTKNNGLCTEELINLTHNIRQWCKLLANAANQEIGYDGFVRNSFQKTSKRDLQAKYKVTDKIKNIKDYKQFLEEISRKPIISTN
ncbi:hypothetical protein ACMYR3_16715 [Ampullimonas aquatilis]|uniref:hypothetical protein n=1 Tax=Ampullimonas aquatilis TaxID=1341549 RepID=UPI003C730872